jgi:diguanylate cyclase
LSLFVAGSVACGTVVVASAVIDLVRDGWPTRLLGWQPAVVLVAVVLAFRLNFRIRIQSENVLFSAINASLLIGLTIVPWSSLVVVTALGLAIATASAKLAPIKVAFNVAKDVLGVGAAILASGYLFGRMFEGTINDAYRLAAASAAILLGDEILGIGIMWAATRTPFWQRFRTNWDIRLGSGAARLALAIVAAYLLHFRPFLALSVPIVIFGLYIVSEQRVRAREERDAWQELAKSTDDFTAVDLDAVLAAGVHRAARLFSANEVEIEVASAATPRRLVRGDEDTITFDGAPEEAENAPGPTIAIGLESHDGLADVGELRLRFRGRVALSERENYTLRSFAAALCTAIRNASVYQQTVQLAESNAHAATHDQLTGLANRRQLEEVGTEVLDGPGSGTVALVVIDLDHFKEINDALGHAAGDRVLAEAAARLMAACDPDDLVVRLGGDEFAVLLRGLGAPALAVPRARVLLGALAEPMMIETMRLELRASVGVATAPATGGILELLRRADLAMFQAKRAGQGVALYSEGMDLSNSEQLKLNAELPRAIARREFTLEFQPVVDLGTGEVISAEALARWHHPGRGELGPAHFIESVERSALLPAFSAAIIDDALRAAATWRAKGWQFPVAVNISARSILDPHFPDDIAQHLARTRVPADGLILEITESAVLSQLQVVDEVLRRLGELGVRLALDDFGTGYSSLSTLARIPVHELKIDQQFVSRLDATTEGAVVRTTVDLGRGLNMLVVAEGVENEEQRRRLWELGCPAGQGHLFARSLPLSRLLATLERGYAGRPGALAGALHTQGSVVRLLRRPGIGGSHVRRDDTG